MTGTAVIDAIKRLRLYLTTNVAVAPYASLAEWVFTNPQEELENKAPNDGTDAGKYFVTIFSDYAPGLQELGDSETWTQIFITLRIGVRYNPMNVDGKEKENADTFYHYVERHLRSMDFRAYMGAAGVKTAPRHVVDAAQLGFDMDHIGMRVYVLRMELWVYLSTTIT